VFSTKPYLPYRLVYFEEAQNRSFAMLREKELKTTKGRNFLKKLLSSVSCESPSKTQKALSKE